MPGTRSKYAVFALAGVVILAGLYLLSRYNYLLFHSFAEGFSIVIAFAIFAIAWNSRRFLDNNYLLFVGIAYLFVGILDFIHTLGYRGMGVFPGYGTNLATQLWIAARYMESLSLLVAPLLLQRKLRVNLTFLVYAAITTLLLASIFRWNIFPAAFVEGAGLTLFKVISEYVISVILLGAIWLLYQRRAAFSSGVSRLVVASIGITIASEMAFTLYTDAFGVANMVGHLLKIVSFYLIYKALIEMGLKSPYDLLFRNLKRSEEQYRGLFGTMSEGFALHDVILDEKGKPSDYRFLEINDAFEKLTGLSRQDVLGKTVRQVLPDVEPHWIETYGRVALTGEPMQIESYSSPLGKWYNAYAYSPAKNRFAVLFMDITERKRAEEALREQEEKFRIVADFTYDWEYWRAPDNSFIYMSPSCERLTGYTAEEFLRNPDLYFSIIHPEDRHAAAGHFTGQTREFCELEFRIIRRDGQERWMSHVCRPMVDEGGKYLGRRASNRDITERKRAEDALKQREAELSAVLASAPILMLVIDAERRVLQANDAALKFSNLSAKELVGQRGGEVLRCLNSMNDPAGCGFGPACEACRLRLSVADTLNTGRNHYQEEWHLPVNMGGREEEIHFLFSTTLMATPEKQVLLCIEDVTELKKAEDELRRRTAELEAVNKELEAFSYSVSHDLRAPLRSMEGFSTALFEDCAHKLNDEEKQYLAYIRESSDLMARLIDDLLKLSRLTRSEMNYERVNLTEAAQKVLAGLKQAEPDRRVEVDIAPDMVAYGDRSLLYAVLENLLGNAWKFSARADSPRIEVGAVNLDGKRAYFVRDNGVGFDMAYAHKLFQPFQRLHKASEYAGTGIGLATVQRVIHRHGGRVWAESGVGKGATFYFTLS